MAATQNLEDVLRLDDNLQLKKFPTKSIGVLCGKILEKCILIEFGHTTPGMTVGVASTTSSKREIIISSNESSFTVNAVKFKI